MLTDEDVQGLLFDEASKTGDDTTANNDNETIATSIDKNDTQRANTMCNKHIMNAYIVSVGFLFVFSAFNTAENFATSVSATLGSISFAITYFTWVISMLTISSYITKLSLVKCNSQYHLLPASAIESTD